MFVLEGVEELVGVTVGELTEPRPLLDAEQTLSPLTEAAGFGFESTLGVMDFRTPGPLTATKRGYCGKPAVNSAGLGIFN